MFFICWQKSIFGVANQWDPTSYLTLVVLKTQLLQVWSPTEIWSCADQIGFYVTQTIRELNHRLQNKNNYKKRWSWQCKGNESYCPCACCLTIATWLVWCPQMTEEVYVNSTFKLPRSCRAYFWVTYSVGIFIHGTMSNFDNPLLVSIKREHHRLNKEKVPFYSEGNSSILKLISERSLPAASPNAFTDSYKIKIL